MCEICRQIPCHPRCPNAPEPEPKYECSECGEGIYEGDRYFDGPDGYICEDCMENKSVEDVLGLFGEVLTTA
ncbi:MAG: hypothetical protein IJL07_08690 [Lachnospiraceae bacterium]|nr:hypothetical protein [Lachnospiraceae bacterium]